MRAETDTARSGRCEPGSTGAVHSSRAVAVLLVLAMSVTAMVVAGGGREASAFAPTTRWSATDRYATSVAVSQQAFPAGAEAVVIANGTSFADALAAGPLASRNNGPVLLTRPHALPGAVTLELLRLAPQRVILVGGPGVISLEVEAEIAALTANPDPVPLVRLAGTNRYETAAAVSAAAFREPDVVYVASGEQFADAMSAGGPAGQLGRPVLLTPSNRLHPATAAELDRLDDADVIVVGGPGAVSSAVMRAIDDVTDEDVTRVNGTDRYLTNVAVNQQTFVAPVANVILVTGTDFPDALGAVPAAKQLQAAILLTRRHCVPAEVMSEIYRLNPTAITIMGGTGAVNADAASLVPCGPPTTPLFSFLQTAIGSTTGLYSRWDPCRGPIRYAIYHEVDMVLTEEEVDAVINAVAVASASSGQMFEFAGLTTSPDFEEGIEALIGYVSSFEQPDIIGLGGIWVGSRLDITEGFAVVLRGIEPDARTDTLLHEIGHLLGLGHAEDVDQLMYPFYTGMHLQYSPGDLEGLRLVGGSMPCLPQARTMVVEEPTLVTWSDEHP